MAILLFIYLAIASLMKLCWDESPQKRPSFKEVINILSRMQFKQKSSSPYPYLMSEHSAVSEDSIENIISDEIGTFLFLFLFLSLSFSFLFFLIEFETPCFSLTLFFVYAI